MARKNDLLQHLKKGYKSNAATAACDQQQQQQQYAKQREQSFVGYYNAAAFPQNSNSASIGTIRQTNIAKLNFLFIYRKIKLFKIGTVKSR